MEAVMTMPVANLEIKSLKVFSKKLGETIDILTKSGELLPNVTKYWMDNGWSNGSNWINGGWSNGSNWVNGGWSNGSNWVNGGWNNGSSWTNGGWSNSSGGGGCYITTAAVDFMGKDDNCDELNLLRKYRDKLVEEDEEFRTLVLEYYKTAPQIVEAINNSEEKEEVLDYIYNKMVKTVIELLKEDRVEEAKAVYLNIYEGLKTRYYKEPNKQLIKK